MMTIRCWLGWHKIRLLGSAVGMFKQGCDRCGKTRIIIVSMWGRPLEATDWSWE